MSTLFELVGGEPAIDAAVDIFYRKVLGDPRIADFFDGVDMSQQAAKQIAAVASSTRSDVLGR
jgi:hemoglobin